MGAVMLAATAIVAAVVIAAMLVGGDPGPAHGSPAKLVAEKERVRAAGPAEPSFFERIGEHTPDIGAASHPLLLIGLAMAATGVAYLLLAVRKGRHEDRSTGGAIIRSAAAVESVLLALFGPLLALIAFIGIGD